MKTDKNGGTADGADRIGITTSDKVYSALPATFQVKSDGKVTDEGSEASRAEPFAPCGAVSPDAANADGDEDPQATPGAPSSSSCAADGLDGVSLGDVLDMVDAFANAGLPGFTLGVGRDAGRCVAIGSPLDVTGEVAASFILEAALEGTGPGLVLPCELDGDACHCDRSPEAIDACHRAAALDEADPYRLDRRGDVEELAALNAALVSPWGNVARLAGRMKAKGDAALDEAGYARKDGNDDDAAEWFATGAWNAGRAASTLARELHAAGGAS